MRRPSSLDLARAPWIRWIPTVARPGAARDVAGGRAVRSRQRSRVLAWTVGASLVIGVLVQTDRVWLARWALAGLAAAVVRAGAAAAAQPARRLR